MTSLYYFFHFLGFLVLLACILLRSARFGFTKGKAVLLCLAAYLSMYGFMLLLKWWVTGTGGQNAIRVYPFLPLFVCLYAYAVGLDIRKSMDFVAVAPCILQGISHIGCIFPGCCYSWLRVNWGIYNPVVDARLFPVQIAESVTALMIAVWLLRKQGKKDACFDGTDMPKMMVLFGMTRFGWEFLRDNEKLFFGISELALWALFMALIGGVWLIAAHHKKNRENKKAES